MIERYTIKICKITTFTKSIIVHDCIATVSSDHPEIFSGTDKKIQ